MEETPNPPDNVSAFVQKTLHLLSIEKEDELEEALQLQSQLSEKALKRRGLCLPKLVIKEQRTGLAGRTLVSFIAHVKSQSDPQPNLPAHRFSAGDIVCVMPSKVKANIGSLSAESNNSANAPQGVVFRVTAKQITIAFEEFPDELADSNKLMSLFMMVNTVSYNRMRDVMNEVAQVQDSHPSSRLHSVLFGHTQPSIASETKVGEFTPYNRNLNHSQIESIRLALMANDIALIHGPPGTGKTTTVVELIYQLIKRGKRVLACAPSNIAVDNMVEKLADMKVSLLRLGHPARLLPSVMKHSLDMKLNDSDVTAIANDIRKDMDKLLDEMKKTRNRGDRYKMRSEMKDLKKELYQREEKATQELIKMSDVILATNIGAADRVLKDLRFDVIVIDEAAQALEASCWIPILKADKLILAGDHQQLPPTITSKRAAKEGLGITLFDRIVKKYGESVTRMLVVQYRMHEHIMRWPSNELYNGKLEAHESVKTHLLKDIPNIKSTRDTISPLLFIDTIGCNMEETKEEDGESKANEGEADIVVQHIKHLSASGLNDSDMAIISPYNAQVQLLRKLLSKQYPNLEIGSVDGFQGREKEAIIISMVRSNPGREIGFLSENRRTNVAVTRARRHLAVIGDSNTITINPFLKRMVEYFHQHGEVRSGMEYTDSTATAVVDLAQVGETSSVASVASGASLDQILSTQSDSAQKSLTKKARKEAKLKAKSPTPTQNQPIETKEDLNSLDLQPSKIEFSVKIEQELKEFLDDEEKTEINYPTTLTAQERAIIHEVSEKLELQHISKGEGNERYICVQKSAIVKEQETTNTTTTTTSKSKKKKKKPSQPQPKEVIPKEPKKAELANPTISTDDDSLLDAAIAAFKYSPYKSLFGVAILGGSFYVILRNWITLKAPTRS